MIALYLPFSFTLVLISFCILASAVQQRSIELNLTENIHINPGTSNRPARANFTLPNPNDVSGKQYNADGTYNVTTGYIGYVQCTSAQSSALWEAVNDAVMLAGGVFSKGELKKRDMSERLNFNTRNAIDYFGPPKLNQPYQQNITETFQRAAQAYPGWGIGDWWYNRKVTVSCKESDKEPFPKCGAPIKANAYFSLLSNTLYPTIVFCPDYFTLPSLAEQLKRLEGNKKLQDHPLQLMSKGTVMLHEWLHISWGSARICQDCTDYGMNLGWSRGPGTPSKAYGPGRAKLLANYIFTGGNLIKEGVKEASKNIDNYVYYAVVEFMYKRFGFYPKLPSPWLADLTEKENIDRELKELRDHVTGSDVDVSDVDVDGTLTPSGTEMVTPFATIPASDYPTQYLSVLSLYEATPITSTAATSVSAPSASTTISATTTKPVSGPTYAIHIAYQTVIIPLLPQPGLPQPPATQYWDEVWLTPTPDFCKSGDVRIKETGRPRTNSPPYAHTSITGLRPSGTSGPKCDWIPGLGYVGPGHLSCDSDPTSVSCKTLDTKPTSCDQGRAFVTPLVECVWQGE